MFVHTFGNVIFVEARCCNSNSDVDESNRNTEKARCNIPWGCVFENSCEDFLDAEFTILSLKSVTKTVSRSMKSDCVSELPSHD